MNTIQINGKKHKVRYVGRDYGRYQFGEQFNSLDYGNCFVVRSEKVGTEVSSQGVIENYALYGVPVDLINS